MFRPAKFARLVAAAVGGVALAATAQAGLQPTNVRIDPDAGNFRWTYAITLPTDMRLQAGNYFTIYDFAGLVDGSIMTPDGWTWSIAKTTPPPAGLKPNDNPLYDDVTFTYNGPVIPTGQLGLGNFALISTFGQKATTEFTAQNPQKDGDFIDRNIVSTFAPGPQNNPGPTDPPPASGVPEPATMALAGLGLPAVGLARLLRRKK
ncbi:MAG: PEP-CTERM sorting domain-containing protein [Gemmataceae bacterium]|nr:PEP-CTERM sorting domain-containing protein [Gemmataceae bacterium]